MARKRNRVDWDVDQYDHESQSAFSYTPYSFGGKLNTTKHIKPKTENQRKFIKSINKNVITLGIGKAGSGKSLLALYQGVQMLNQEQVKRIIYIRPNVRCADEIDPGALPGSLSDKIAPSLAGPVLDNLIEFCSESEAKAVIEMEKILVLPLGYIRGRSFKGSYIILDEAQGCDHHKIKAVLTRISEGSKLVVVGDESQTDILKTTFKSGLEDCALRLQNCPDVGVVRFGREDIVRHSVIPHILERYGG